MLTRFIVNIEKCLQKCKRASSFIASMFWMRRAASTDPAAAVSLYLV